VKYAGAPAGTVARVRYLTAQEKTTLAPNLVEIHLSIEPEVPDLPSDVQVSIAADTLLSDKYVLISGGTPGAPLVGENDILRGIAPVTIDQFARNADAAVNSLLGIVRDGAAQGTPDIFREAREALGKTSSLLADIKPVVGEVRSLVDETRSTVAEVRKMVGDARVAAGDARELMADTKPRIGRTLEKIEGAATSAESLAKRGDALVRKTEPTWNRSMADLQFTLENFKVTSAYTKILLRDLNEHPNRLLWGGKPPVLPTEKSILNSKQVESDARKFRE